MGGAGKAMGKAEVLQKLRKFLRKNLWEIPEVQEAVAQLERLAVQHDWYPSDVLNFEIMCGNKPRALRIVFSAPVETLGEDSVKEMHRWQEVIATAVQSFVLKTLEAEGLPWEIVNEL